MHRHLDECPIKGWWRPADSTCIAVRAPAIIAVLGAGFALLGCQPPPSHPQPGDSDPYPDTPFVEAQSSRSFGDSVGVGVRLTWIDTSYGNFDAVRARLLELGVRNVHDGLCPSCDYQVNRLKALSALGIKSLIGVGDLRGGTAQMQASLDGIRDKLPGVVTSVVAPNEPDLEPVADWVGKTRAYQQELYTRVKSDPALAHLPVLGPSLVHRESRTLLGDLSQYLDRGNIHPYPGGALPLANLDDEKALAAIVSGGKPLVATEVGYHANLATNEPHRGVSETANAMYTPRLVLEAFRGGIERTYLFQLADAWSDAEAARIGVPATENAFGLLRYDLTPRPSFIALRNLMRAVHSGSAGVSSPGGLRLALEGEGSDVRRLLLRSADGSYGLVLWRQVSVWDRDAKRSLSPAPDRVDVVMGQPMSTVRRFDPVVSDAELERWTLPRRVSVDLAGAPVVLRLTPQGATAAASSGSQVAAASATLQRSSRKASKGKSAKRKASKRKASKRKASKRKVSKRKVAERKAAKVAKRKRCRKLRGLRARASSQSDRRRLTRKIRRACPSRRPSKSGRKKRH